MLVLSRRDVPGEDTINFINNTDHPLVFQPQETIASLTVVRLSGNQVRIGLNVSPDILVLRGELKANPVRQSV